MTDDCPVCEVETFVYTPSSATRRVTVPPTDATEAAVRLREWVRLLDTADILSVLDAWEEDRKRIARVLDDLHYRTEPTASDVKDGWEPYCGRCGMGCEYPCPTVRALTEASDDE